MSVVAMLLAQENWGKVDREGASDWSAERLFGRLHSHRGGKQKYHRHDKGGDLEGAGM